MPQPSVIQARGLGRAFTSGMLFRRTTIAVREATFSIEPGKTLAVVGESGCGKTTLARMAAGLIKPNAGSVQFLGRDIAAWPRRELSGRLQFVFQDADDALNPNLTARQLLLEPMLLGGWPKRNADERLPELMDMVGLTSDLLKRHPHEMSGGQRQRIGLARAMCLGPKLVIADEPVASLDRSIQAQILSLFRAFQERDGVAYLYISHDLQTVGALADHVAVMLGGVFVETGPAGDVFRNPAHPYTRMLLEASGESSTLDDRAADIQSEIVAGQGCPLTTACPFASAACGRALPALVGFEPRRAVRCTM